jgi:hypothetical protein
MFAGGAQVGERERLNRVELLRTFPDFPVVFDVQPELQNASS